MNLVLLQTWLDNLTFVVLFATALFYWISAAFPSLAALWSLGTSGMAIANLCIATLLGARWLEAGYFPLSNLYESLFFIAWGITAVHLFAERSTGSRWVGVLSAPLATGIAAFAALSLPATMQAAEPLVPALQSNWLMMHVSVMLLSYAALMVGSLLSLAFLVVTRGKAVELRGSSIGTGSFRDRGNRLQLAKDAATSSSEMDVAPVLRTSVTSDLNGSSGTQSIATPGSTAVLTPPTVETISTPSDRGPSLSPQRLTLAGILDNTSYRIIGLGFPLLTVGIISGAVWANEAWGTYWSWDPKETWAFIVWLVYAAYLHARLTRGWQGRRPALLAASGFAVTWVCYLGVNLLGRGLHSYGWFF